MTEEQKQTIVRLRDMGLGYRKIGIALDIPRDKVCNYCKAKGIDGYARRLIENKEWKQLEEACQEVECRRCSNSIEINPGRAEACTVRIGAERSGTKNIPLFISTNVCFAVKSLKAAPGSKNFAAGICYVRNGFWRQEDTEEVVKLLLAGKKVPRIPKWMKELLGE